MVRDDQLQHRLLDYDSRCVVAALTFPIIPSAAHSPLTVKMALHRSSSSKGSRTDGDKDDDDRDNNGYIQIFVKPLEQGNYRVILSWLGLSHTKLTRQQVGMATGAFALLGGVVLYQLLLDDIGTLFQRLAALVVPIFAIASAFFWLALHLRNSWTTTSVYILFLACFFSEFIGQYVVDRATASDSYVARPALAVLVLVAASGASVFSPLETGQSAALIVAISVVRFLAATTLTDVPAALRPFTAYLAGITGVIGAKYMETLFKTPVTSYMASEGKIPVIKRRRSSASTMHGFSNTHRAGRRTSLPALIPSKSQSSAISYEAAIISEAHGLITDMLADTNLHPHVTSGLRTVSNLLKPPETPHMTLHKAKLSPLVSLAETTNYGSDNEDLPYTGERPSSLPKRLRRSLPPSLIRRMSTSTWTTTTSATGMPTLEPEPCRTRSSSFRHSRDNTPGSSPVGSRSNSPSPSSPTTISLAIPKSRSFSLATVSNSANQKRSPRERRSLQQHNTPSSGDFGSNTLSPVKSDQSISPLALTEAEVKEGSNETVKGATPKDLYPGLSRRLNITSDYESSDSPGSSDHSDNVTSTDEQVLSPPNALQRQTQVPTSLQVDAALPRPTHKDTHRELTESKEHLRSQETIDRSQSGFLPGSTTTQTVRLSDYSEEQQHEQQDQQQSDSFPGGTASEAKSEEDELSLPYDLEQIDNNTLLSMSRLSQWDYPIFDLMERSSHTILSQVTYKLFLETGLFETFRIPIPEFLTYFHALELGYREKPYHNRVHATDVLHGVYYLMTQPIPGFHQVAPDPCDFLNKHASSSESDSETSEKACCHRASFTAEDTYGILAGNFPALELMALFTAAAMHDYDHPGRTNAFLVATHSSLAVLYNDRSVLESHHAASAWRLLMSNPNWNWLCHLEKAEFKRFRFLVIEAILSTDLKRHFEMVAEFNAKVNDEEASELDWTNEADRLMVSNMVIKLADINGPTKRKDLHVAWTDRITEEFYEQGDEEANMGMTISPYMDRRNPQLAKLQESFINHLVAPLCNCLGAAGLLPGTWVEDDNPEDVDSDKCESKDTEDEEDDLEPGEPRSVKKETSKKRIHCWLTKNLEDNHAMWVVVLKQEAAVKEREAAAKQVETDPAPTGLLEPMQLTSRSMSVGDKEMESIKEEDTPPNSANSVKEEEMRRASLPALIQRVGPGGTGHWPAPYTNLETAQLSYSCSALSLPPGGSSQTLQQPIIQRVTSDQSEDSLENTNQPETLLEEPSSSLQQTKRLGFS